MKDFLNHIQDDIEIKNHHFNSLLERAKDLHDDWGSDNNTISDSTLNSQSLDTSFSGTIDPSNQVVYAYKPGFWEKLIDSNDAKMQKTLNGLLTNLETQNKIPLEWKGIEMDKLVKELDLSNFDLRSGDELVYDDKNNLLLISRNGDIVYKQDLDIKK